MTRSAATIWCPSCEEYSPCRSLSSSEAAEFERRRGPRFYKVDHEDIQFFLRFRRCGKCDEEFQTAEVEMKFLDELVKLRTALAGIKIHATSYEEDAKNVAQKLNGLGEWLAIVKAL